MLGRLLNTAAASLNPAAHSTKNYPNQLESVTEEEHIAGLLFPATLNDNNLIITTDNSQQSPLHFNRYPSATAINHSGTSSYDDRGRLDPAPFRNFRLVIAQDALGDRDEPCILFDTERHGLNSKKSPLSAPTPTPTPTPAPATTPATATATAPRTGNAVSNNNPTIIPQRSKYPTLTHSPFHSASATQDTLRSTFRHPWRKETPDPPLTARPSALFSARRRNSPLLQSAQDADSYRVFSDASLLNCIFGSNAFTYRGSSTKMHILPQDADGSDEPDVAALKSPRFRADSVQSSSSSTGHHGSIPPHASATAAPGPNHHAFLRRETNGNDYRSSHPNEMTVMITRMFCINLHIDAHTPPETQSPAGPANASSPPPATAPRETKTPMFAVAITIKLPLPKTNSSGASTSTTTAGAGSYKNREFMSASVDSDHKWSPNLLNGLNDTLSTSNMNDRIDMLVEHWDSITRAIACVEKIASKEILTHLEATDIQMRQRMKMHRSPHPRTLVVTLAPNSLSESSQVRDEAARAIKRIYMALRIPRVVTGQSRWGIWREEARWVSKSLSSKGQRLFFPVLMTAFLGNHTEWIQFLGPDWHKRRRFLQHKLKKENEPIIPNRTVIISADKMTSRRLIFVLSSFLPRQQGSEYSQISPPEASVQLLSGPQSPSLPSAMNRDRPDSSRKHSHFRHASGKGRFTHHFSASVPFTDISAVATQASGNANNSNSTTKPLERSTSSTLDELWQPSYHSNPLRNTASATVAYAAPEASIPVAHFSHESKRYSSGARYSSSGNGGSGSGTGGGYGGGGSSGEIDDESSSSMASENLMRNLRSSTDLPARPSGRSPQDTSSAATASTSTAAFAKKSSQPRHSRWDSILPGFWSSGSASSNGNNKSHQASLTTATTTATETTTKKLVVSTSALKSDARRGENSQRPVTFDTVRGKHGEDVNQQSQEQYGDDRAGELTTLAGAGDGKGRRAEVQARESQDGTSPESITSPIKISGCCDGVVDVELPLPGFVSLSPSTEAQMIPSYQKIRPSPASPDNCGSFQSNTSAPLHTPIWKEYDGLNINVAGWLKRFHEDFLLQAVRPYEELENDIRRTMSAEPTPANIVAMMSDHDHANDGDDGGESIGVWYDVCVTLIADVKACSVKQLRLQRRMVRKVKKKQKERNNSCYSANSSHHPPLPTQLSAQPTPPMELEQAVTEIEEQFIEESVVEVDDVFIEAVDRVLARNVPPTTSASTSTTATAAATPGNRVSKGRSASGQSLTLFGGTGGSGNINRRRSIQLRLDENHASDRTDGDNMSITEVPRAECSRLVLGALEEVVRSVTAERYSEDEHGVDDVLLNATSTPTVAATATTATTTPYKSLSRKPTNQENTLREGIRKWLSEVEETC